MAKTIKTWIFKVKPGRVDDALDLFRASKVLATDEEITVGEDDGGFLLDGDTVFIHGR